VQPEPERLETAEPRPIRVLHVDDEPDFADVAARFLEREDDRFTVLTATEASEGLDRLATERVDCIVSDYDMPGQNGLEFLVTVRERSPDLPFILFTGKGGEEVASEAISAGVTDYLQKEGGTGQYAILANRIANVVEGRRSRRASAARERRLETLISNLPGIVYRCRDQPDWPMEFVEGECAALTGYPASALEADEVSWGEDVLHLDDRERVWADVRDALATDDSFEVTYRIVTADGTTKWMWERGREVTTPDDEPNVLEGFITDITARKERERELERTNALRSTLFDALPVGVLAEDADRRVMAVNQRMVDLFDLPGTPASLTGTDCAELVETVSDEFAASRAFVDRTEELVAEGTPDIEELALADGRTIGRIHRPIELPDGEGHLWVYRDVTDRTERERELERYEGIVEASGDPVYTLDSDGHFTFVNDALIGMTGHEADDLLGEHVSVVIDRDDIEAAEQLIRSLLSSGEDRGTVELDVHTADGERIPCEAHISLLPFEDEFRATVGVVRDLTERAERERKLDRLRERTQALMYAETRVEMARIATEAAENIIGAPMSGVHLLNDAADALELSAITETGADVFDEVPRYPRDDEPGSRAAIVWDVFEQGEPRWIDDVNEYDRLIEETPAGSAILHPVGRHGVFMVSSPDSGAFDDTDEALVELLATSLRTGMDRVEREAELRRRNERLDQFTSVVSHDLRNPLNVAEGHLDLAHEEGESDHLDAVGQAHERMDELINDLLTFAREGETATDTEPLGLAPLVESCWRNVETAETDLVVESDRTVRADRSRVQQLIENLFRNAVEHGGDVVTVGDLADGFYVADDGPGIPEADREAVFEAGHSTTHDGTGFGLAIVGQVAEAHGWDVTVTESADGGARFEVTCVEFADRQTGDGEAG